MLGVWSLKSWTTREVPFTFFNMSNYSFFFFFFLPKGHKVSELATVTRGWSKLMGYVAQARNSHPYSSRENLK